jgi:citrate synthase
MATSVRIASSVRGLALKQTSPFTAFNAARCYSSKTQTLKERFAELLPEKIEEIKALRK